MSLQGLPDFQNPVRGEGCTLFAPYEGIGKYALLPESLVVARRAGGRLHFTLQFVRGQIPGLPPDPYAVLDLGLQPRFRLEDGLSLARSLQPRSQVEPVAFSGGFFRLYPASPAVELPEDLAAPIPLAWNGLNLARPVLRLSLESGLLLQGALLEGEALLLEAQAEMEIPGIAPRVPVEVSFDPMTLLGDILTRAEGVEGRLVAYERLVDTFRRGPEALPITARGETIDLNDFAEAMALRTRSRFGSFTPAPRVDGCAYMALQAPEETGPGVFTWDLSEPFQSWRPLVLQLHPLEAARQIVQEESEAGIIPPPVIVPPMPTGILPVSISANLPERLDGIVALGVLLQADPRPPMRPQAVARTVELAPPDFLAQAWLALSPAETPEYRYTPFAVVEDERGAQQLEGQPVLHHGDRISLSPEDFPVTFLPVEASPALMDLCAIEGAVRYFVGSEPRELRFQLDRDRPSVALTLPGEAEGIAIEARACPQAGREILLDPLPAGPALFGLHSFAEFGPHTIQVTCNFSSSGVESAPALVVLEMMPEGLPEAPESISILALTPAQPLKVWNYLAESPFRAGYRYRRLAEAGQPPAAWSEIRSPLEDLAIQAN